MKRSRTCTIGLVLLALFLGFCGPALAQDLQAFLDDGNECYKRSDFQRALAAWEKGLKWAKANNDKQAISTFTGNIGIVYRHLGDYSKALAHYQEALEIDREIGYRKGIGYNLTNIGLLYANIDDYSKALAHYQEALKIDREIGDRKGIGATICNMGNVYAYLGDYSKALAHYQEALKIDREIGDRKGVGAELGNIGNVYSDLGDYPKALAHYKEALEIRMGIGDRTGAGVELGNIGTVYSDLGDYPKALAHYKEALEIFSSIGTRPGEEIAIANIGDVYLEQGEFKKAEAQYQKIGGDTIREGRLALAQKDFPMAKSLFSERLKLDQEGRKAGFLFAELVGLGLACEGLGQDEEARRHFQQAVDMLEQQREGLTESQRTNFYEAKVMGFQRLLAYEGLARTLYRLKRPEEAFLVAESTRARALAEAMSRRGEKTGYRIPPDVQRQETELINRIAGLHKMMDKLFEQKQMGRYREVKEDLGQEKKNLESLLSVLRKNYPEYAAVKYPIPLKAEQLKLRPEEVLVSYQTTDTGVLCYVVRQGKVISAEWVGIQRKDLEERVRQYRLAYEGVTHESDLKRHDTKLSRGLYDLLLRKALGQTKQGDKVILSPDGILGLLPFEALVMEEGAEKYAGDVHNIAYAHSGTSLTLGRMLKKGKEKTSGLLVVADPVFSTADARITRGTQLARAGDYEVRRMGMVAERITGTQDTFGRLVETGLLAKRLVTLFPDEGETLTGLDATREKVYQRPLDRYRYLVFATHGILDKDVPYIQQPALVLCQVNTKDGFLTMTDVMGLNLKSEVAALTACSTGVGKRVSGEGVMHMGRGFQYAGAKSVLMSLWSVAEDSTTCLTERFFVHLKEGKDARTSLRQARKELRTKNAAYNHPFYWGGFILMAE